ncbi:RNA polymerase Rbp10 [Methanothermus fervidus DSM 2088]|uniref:DNA-directed RNA polymerase subunit Rpo12 n=1 Tax=Methanothermus fervidus (strain ATCC 43054 / DSM 2088 / JCM 10308 / V24 S) TaxID=523846 RepID=E3GZ94_METFV|nr:DNA-directed RNA polymerase subunit P [Methanothermus fervidus]ADP77626.1 RNA polymerase Rbp10 [Methanothermus fervidus DSM 2088]
MYKCLRCGTTIDPKKQKKYMCPKCRYRILLKEQPEIVRELRAR